MTTPSEFKEVPISRLVDLRHELTALIARNHLDDFVFRMTDDSLLKGRSADLAPLKRGIILETYVELLTILDDYSRRFGRGRKAVKQGMSTVVGDPDVFGRFHADHQTKIHAIAGGSSLFAKWRFDRVYMSIRTEAGRYM